MSAGKYAHDTDVPIGRSREEIEGLVRKYNARRFAYGWDEDTGNAVMEFEMEGRRVRFRLVLPQRAEFTRTPTGKERSATAATAAWEQACRARWRALVLVVKAKLESIAVGIETFDEAFLAQVVVPDGRTFGAHALPAIDEAYRTQRLPALLLALEDGR